MQTFLPFPSFELSAKVLDNRRLGKQRVECLQILTTLAKGKYTHTCAACKHIWTDNADLNIECPNCKNYYEEDKDVLASKCIYTKRTAWYNHPAVKMWRGYNDRLFEYASIICEEWTNRGFKDTCLTKLEKALLSSTLCLGKTPKFRGDKAFHLSHQSNLLRKDYNHYKPLFDTENAKLGWTTPPDNLPYIWPVK